MNEKPFVSIIIPFYNTPKKEFRRCIKSIIEQTNGDFEVIVVNDGSKKEYADVLKKVTESDERIRLINKINEGSAVARNIGIREANGDYIMFVDSDDVITRFCLEEAAKIVEISNPDLIIGGCRKFSEFEIDSVNYKRKSKPRYIKVVSSEKRNALMTHMVGNIDESFSLNGCYVADGPVARVLRKSIAKESFFSNENMWNDDTVWNTKMLKKCESIVIIDELWYKYLIYPNSKTRKYRQNCQYEFEYRTKQEIDLFKEHWPDCMEGIYTRVFNDIVLLCRTFLFHPDNPRSMGEKYQIYKSCVHTEAYREALCGVNLKREKRIVNRLVKELLRFTAYYGPHIISYWILWSFYNLRKNQL